jgi:ubiquinone/menaquinone biosynthesis C-methylase UbiE
MLKTGYDLTDEEIVIKYSSLSQRRGLGAEFNRRVISVAGNLSGKKILDTGCGYGELLIEIDKNNSDSYLCGIDQVDVRVKEVSEKLAKCIIKDGNIQKRIPFEDNFFDFVFCTETLEHLKNPDQCLQEIIRVLKKTGFIVITVPNGTGFWPFLYLDSLIPTKWLRSRLLPYEHPLNTDQPIDTCYKYGEIIELICRNGLIIEKIEGWRYLRYLQMLPVIRNICPFVEWFLPIIKMERLAYNLFFLCQKGEEN